MSATDNNQAKPKRSVYADKISEITGWTHAKSLDELRYADRLGIKRSMYFSVRGYEWTHRELDALGYELQQKNTRKDEKVSKDIDIIMEDLSCSKEDALKNLERRKEYNIHRRVYTANECHLMTDAELKVFSEQRVKRLELMDKVSEGVINDIKDPAVKELFDLAPKARKTRIADVIEKYLGTIDDSEKNRIAREMDFLNLRYKYSFKEYFLFGFKDKTQPEIEQFIANTRRKDYLRRLNTPRGFIICRNKALSYERLKDLYKRDIVEITGAEDLDKAREFITKHPDFVFKPLDSSFGDGIVLIHSEGKDDDAKLAAELVEKAPFILEELIIADDRIKALHPASINTIRVTTYLDDNGNVTIHLPFFKIGQKGTFVDNGGSGGIFALIDAETGIVISDGKDEDNNRYEAHPDTGIRLKGFQVPEWDALKEFADLSARAFPEVRYAGWDMALSKDKGWLVVEVNCRTQFFGQQMCDEIGKKQDLEKLINWPELSKEKDEFEEIWEAVDKN